jgi:AraC family transcriptional activator of pobA
MKKTGNTFLKLNSVAAYHELLHLPKPEHPLVSLIDFSQIDYLSSGTPIIMGLYCIYLKQGADCILRYGPQTYDFSEGVLSFIKPGQVVNVTNISGNLMQGFILVFHPDFIQSSILAEGIKRYDFFDYSVNEALFLSEKEKLHIREIMSGISREYHTNIDSFSQDAIVSYIHLLLVYADRYYSRQFITRRPKNDQLMIQFEKLLDSYFSEEKPLELGLPTVQYFAQYLNLSPNYLSDMLRISTGKSAQGHIQDRMIEKAKTLLGTSELSVAEIAYRLGFEQPQSFNRLFKKKTDLSPMRFRDSLN